MRLAALLSIAALVNAPCLLAGDIDGDIHSSLGSVGSVEPDLKTPPATAHAPAAGKRVRQVNKNYATTQVHHLLYLPTDWVKGKKYPVIVEYAGNQFKSSPGTVEGSNLGYGISGGEGVIWLCLPYINKDHSRNEVTWWGDVDASVDYCKQTVRQVCADYGGDPSRLFIAGFSRGAIACHYIGLHDDEIASLWRGFICHSHYDGVRKWNYEGSDRLSAALRLKRLGRRPQFISQEGSIEETKEYLKQAHPMGDFTFQALPFPEHTDTWVLRDTAERKVLRDWFKHVLKEGN